MKKKILLQVEGGHCFRLEKKESSMWKREKNLIENRLDRTGSKLCRDDLLKPTILKTIWRRVESWYLSVSDNSIS